MKATFLILLFSIAMIPASRGQELLQKKYQIVSFGEGGTKNMTYDRRQRPQALLMGDVIHLVYNGGAPADADKMVKTMPFAISYNIKSGKFSKEVQLSGKPSKDHHYGPIIWADNNDFLHVLSGCHLTPGTHIVSKKSGNIGESSMDWEIAPQIAPSMSYPSVSNIYNKQKLIYYRTGGHRSSWTYSITSDEGRTWHTPDNPVVDLNNNEDLLPIPHAEMDEASSYHTYLPSRDGKSILVAFMYYDDNKKNLPEKSYNPLYKKSVGTLKTNLYFVKIDLTSGKVRNFQGEDLETPILLDVANKKCKIWDTNWRGAGVPPDIIFDKHENPAFLHVLTEDIFEKLNYYYVRRVGNEWKQTIIAPACHKWNSSHLALENDSVLHAYLLMDDAYFESKGKGEMNSHGGGTRIEEWVSSDDGFTWRHQNTLLKAEGAYEGWRFNNIQPVKTKEGKIKEDVLLFYGWNEKEGSIPGGKAFLLVDHTIKNK